MPVDAGVLASLRGSPSLPGGFHRAVGGAGAIVVGVSGRWVLCGERCLAESGDVAAAMGWWLDRDGFEAVSFPHCHHIAPRRHPMGALGASSDSDRGCGCRQE